MATLSDLSINIESETESIAMSLPIFYCLNHSIIVPVYFCKPSSSAQHSTLPTSIVSWHLHFSLSLLLQPSCFSSCSCNGSQQFALLGLALLSFSLLFFYCFTRLPSHPLPCSGRAIGLARYSISYAKSARSDAKNIQENSLQLQAISKVTKKIQSLEKCREKGWRNLRIPVRFQFPISWIFSFPRF